MMTGEARVTDFNPRSPHGERPAHSNPAGASQSFQSTLPARGATRRLMSYMQSSVFQSTLPARGATLRVPSFLLTQPFQSTLPARGATLQRQHIAAGIPHFNPRSPHGERPCSARRCGLLRPISIHAPRTGSDGICIVFSFRQYGRISIHAPRTGSDHPAKH